MTEVTVKLEPGEAITIGRPAPPWPVSPSERNELVRLGRREPLTAPF